MTQEPEALNRTLSAYVVKRRDEGDEGKTFLLGVRDATPVFCVAAGLRDDDARRHFLTLGRYLLQGRFRCRDFAIAWPAVTGAGAAYVIDVAQGDQRLRWLLGDDDAHDEGPEAGGFLDAMGQPAGTLPAVLRRDLDGLFEAFRLPLA